MKYVIDFNFDTDEKESDLIDSDGYKGDSPWKSMEFFCRFKLTVLIEGKLFVITSISSRLNEFS